MYCEEEGIVLSKSGGYVPSEAPSEQHYLHAQFHGSEARVQAMVLPPFGPGFSAAQAMNCEHLEAWGTRATLPSEDHVLWRGLRGGKVVCEKTIAGF